MPLQYACLENPIDRGAWWAPEHWGHKESDTAEQLSTCGSTVDEADPSVNFLLCHLLYYFGTPMDRGAWWATAHGFTESGVTKLQKV